MKISLWNLCDQLPFPSVEAHIADNRAVIRYARLASEAPFADDTVYVRSAKDLPGGHDAAVLHGEDALYVDGEPISALFNCVASIMDRFQSWEKELLLAQREENGVQLILDSAQAFLPGAYYALTYGGKTLGFSCPPASDLYPVWNEIFSTGDLTYERLSILDKYIDFSGFRPNVPLTTERSPAGDFYYSYRGIDANGTNIGFLIYCSRSPELPGGAGHFLRILAEHISLYFSYHVGQINLISHASEMLQKCLHGTQPGEDVKQFFRDLSWPENGEYQFLALRSDAQGKSAKYIRILRSLFPSPLFCAYDQDMMVMLNRALLPDCDDKLRQFLTFLEKDVTVGLSNPFHYLYQSGLYAAQAREEREKAAREETLFRDASRHDRQYFSALLRSDRLCRSYVHRSLLRLLDYDTRHRTEYYETLRAFVLSYFHHSDAARILHIHRNTLLYRLESIRGIIDLSEFDAIAKNGDTAALYRYYISFFMIDEIRYTAEDESVERFPYAE